jgi:hypothetical protein
VRGPAGVALTVAGAVLAAVTVRRIMPPGMLTMRAGLPVATMALFCCAFAFFAVDGFVPLLLTSVDRRSVPAAGIVVTLAVLAVLGWTAGGMAQARLARRGLGTAQAGDDGHGADHCRRLRHRARAAWPLACALPGLGRQGDSGWGLLTPGHGWPS